MLAHFQTLAMHPKQVISQIRPSVIFGRLYMFILYTFLSNAPTLLKAVYNVDITYHSSLAKF